MSALFDDIDDADMVELDEAEAIDYVPESGCWKCGAIYGPDNTGHCSPNTGGCCLSFHGNTAFMKHLMPAPDRWDPSLRLCHTVEEIQDMGFTQTGKYGSWVMPQRVKG